MKTFITLLTACAIGLGSAFAADGEKKPAKGKKPRPALNEDQRELMKEIREKYDADKDGKLTPKERAKISDEDKKRIKDAGIGGPRKKGPAVSEEMRALQKEITGKYDENKDGKLDKEERAKISDEDKKRVKDARMAALKDKPKKLPPKKEGGKKGKGGKKKDEAEK